MDSNGWLELRATVPAPEVAKWSAEQLARTAVYFATMRSIWFPPRWNS